MKTIRIGVFAVVACLVLIGCKGKGSSSTGPSGATSSGGSVYFETNSRQMVQIVKDGIKLLTGNGHYIIGDCDGADGPNNIWSINERKRLDENMSDRPGCPGAQFTLQYTRIGSDRIRADMSIGPMRGNIRSIKAALDGNKAVFTHFQFAGGSQQPFDDNVAIPVAAGKSNGAVAYVDYISPDVVIRRTPSSGYLHIQCNSHPSANNCDIEFTRVDAGDTITFSEEIWVRGG